MENSAPARNISGSSSAFLDALRICAALLVLIVHAFNKWFLTKAYRSEWPGEPSHVAVIVFFVLSGYVIGYTTISKNRGAMQYAQARLSRLCSIVIPVILITACIHLFISIVNPEALLKTRGSSVLRYILSSFYLNELWLFSAAPPLNGSLWSLSFEFWYYTVFGLWFFRKPGLKSTLLLILAIVVAGPKIILMMPIWIMGYLAYRLPGPNISPALAWCLIGLTFLSGAVVAAFLPPLPYVIHLKPLYYANQFFTDWVLALFVSFALWLLPNGNGSKVSSKPANLLRKIADLTFPLYVLHFPLIVLWKATIGIQYDNFWQLCAAIVFVLITASVIGYFLEKQRPLWTRFFKWLLTNGRNFFNVSRSDKSTANHE
ncbi:acyltransferase family protein [Mucilaginibacter calamicampi]|uniref:Acyltransferase family protein n=1 Tax=Mucilaginibacter calamicampi TaxID=1302352 RepID=A0ABW2YWD2_9SPHI